MAAPLTNYKPPESREELLRCYTSGERNFPDTELSDTDHSGVMLDGASFEKCSWLFIRISKEQACVGRVFASAMSNVRAFEMPISQGHLSSLRLSRKQISVERH
jgi:hypothetical protein